MFSEQREKVSIVIPVYNVERYLSECIDSVLNQTYKNLQIILVDDGSEDSSPKICDEYARKDERITVIHKKNGGLSDARNTGLSSADGDYVYFLDSDDYIDSDTVEILVKEVRITQADLLFFDSEVENESNTDAYPQDFYIRKELYSNPKIGYQMAEDLMRYGEFYTSVPMLFIKKSLLDDNSIKFMNGILHEDELFTFVVFMNSKCAVHVAVPFYHRRVRDFSIMTVKASVKNYYGLRAIFRELQAMYAVETDINKKELIKMEQKHIFDVIFAKYLCVKGKERKEAQKDFNEFKDEIKNLNFFNSNNVIRKCKYPYLYRLLSCKVAKKMLEKLLLMRNNITAKRKNASFAENLNKRAEGEKRIVLIGVPTHGNLGDHAIAQAEHRYFKSRFSDYKLIEIPMTVYNSIASCVQKSCTQDDVIVISGGGWLGDLWLHNEITARDIVKRMHNLPVIIMPQTIYFSKTERGKKELAISKEIFNKHKKLMLFLRDKNSVDFSIETQYVPNSIYAPDMALYGFLDDMPKEKRNGALLCFRKDREKANKPNDIVRLEHKLYDRFGRVRYTTTVYTDGISPADRVDRLFSKLTEYASSSIVVTDRLHSMIFAALTGTPCVAIDNLTRKVSGVYEWIRELPYIKTVSSVDEVMDEIGSIDINNEYEFPHKLLEDKFDKMEELIKEYITCFEGRND